MRSFKMTSLNIENIKKRKRQFKLIIFFKKLVLEQKRTMSLH